MRSPRRTLTTGIAILAAAAAAIVGGAGSAAASTEYYVGYGYPNNPHSVWCVQKLIDDLKIGIWVPQDNLFGPKTYQAIKYFQGYADQHYAESLGQDGVVGPATASALLWDHYNYYSDYCSGYLP